MHGGRRRLLRAEVPQRHRALLPAGHRELLSIHLPLLRGDCGGGDGSGEAPPRPTRLRPGRKRDTGGAAEPAVAGREPCAVRRHEQLLPQGPHEERQRGALAAGVLRGPDRVPPLARALGAEGRPELDRRRAGHLHVHHGGALALQAHEPDDARGAADGGHRRALAVLHGHPAGRPFQPHHVPQREHVPRRGLRRRGRATSGRGGRPPLLHVHLRGALRGGGLRLHRPALLRRRLRPQGVLPVPRGGGAPHGAGPRLPRDPPRGPAGHRPRARVPGDGALRQGRGRPRARLEGGSEEELPGP
mmetsp:Transcript_114208/g.333923  ORF Transcript_114208/g.333923 Transcript_114208/m.333923 type:complete len:302 (+) Transcript_114208:374-1279(+)